MTPPAPGPTGRAPARVEDALFLDIHGVPQFVTLRGDDRAHPAILMLHGPGFAFSPLAPVYALWEAEFTVVQWDQPGAGASPDAELSLERLVRDGLAVAEAIGDRLPGAPLVLFGVSGGSILGLMMLEARPDLFAAYVGNGQVVDWGRQAQLSYEMILDRARAAGDAATIAEIEGVGPPPWADIAADAVRGKYANAMTRREQAAFADPAFQAGFAAVPANTRERSAAAFLALKPQIDGFDARALGLSSEVPMIFLQGEEDAHLVSSEVEAFAAEVGGRHVPLPGLGHMSNLMAGDLLPHLRRELAFLRDPGEETA
jgi:proline iminopeptidase